MGREQINDEFDGTERLPEFGEFGAAGIEQGLELGSLAAESRLLSICRLGGRLQGRKLRGRFGTGERPGCGDAAPHQSPDQTSAHKQRNDGNPKQHASLRLR